MAKDHRTEWKIFDWLKFIFCVEKIEFYFTPKNRNYFLAHSIFTSPFCLSSSRSSAKNQHFGLLRVYQRSIGSTSTVVFCPKPYLPIGTVLSVSFARFNFRSRRKRHSHRPAVPLTISRFPSLRPRPPWISRSFFTSLTVVVPVFRSIGAEVRKRLFYLRRSQLTVADARPEEIYHFYSSPFLLIGIRPGCQGMDASDRTDLRTRVVVYRRTVFEGSYEA